MARQGIRPRLRRFVREPDDRAGLSSSGDGWDRELAQRREVQPRRSRKHAVRRGHAQPHIAQRPPSGQAAALAPHGATAVPARGRRAEAITPARGERYAGAIKPRGGSGPWTGQPSFRSRRTTKTLGSQLKPADRGPLAPMTGHPPRSAAQGCDQHSTPAEASPATRPQPQVGESDQSRVRRAKANIGAMHGTSAAMSPASRTRGRQVRITAATPARPSSAMPLSAAGSRSQIGPQRVSRPLARPIRPAIWGTLDLGPLAVAARKTPGRRQMVAHRRDVRRC